MSDAVKLPVVDTLSQSLGFASKRMLTTFKVSLVPGLLFGIPMAWLMVTVLGKFMEMAPPAPGTEGPSDVPAEEILEIFALIGPLYLLVMILSCLAMAMIAVPLVRKIVLDEAPGFFRLDGIVWRYFFGFVIYALLNLVVLLAIFGPTAAIIAALEEAQVHEAASVGVGLLAVCLAVLVLVRLSLFMVEIAVSGKFGVRAAFKVTRGNFWRLIGAGLLAFVAMMAVQIVFQILLTLFGVLALASNAEVLEAAGEAEDVAAVFSALKDTFVSPMGGIMGLIYLVYALFILGFQTALPALIYKNLGGGEARA